MDIRGWVKGVREALGERGCSRQSQVGKMSACLSGQTGLNTRPRALCQQEMQGVRVLLYCCWRSGGRPGRSQSGARACGEAAGILQNLREALPSRPRLQERSGCWPARAAGVPCPSHTHLCRGFSSWPPSHLLWLPVSSPTLGPTGRAQG